MNDNISVFILIQEGGSSQELYLHTHNTMEEAKRDRISCAEASYSTSPVLEVPKSLADHPDFHAVVESLLGMTFELSEPESVL
jgi:hypothetical protein